MKLLEILDKPYKYELVEKDHDWSAHFEDESGEIVSVRFEYWGGPQLYIVDFQRKGSFEMTNDSPTDKNQAIRIMATVTAIIKDVINQTKSTKYPSKFIAFSSKKTESSRSSLYDRMVKRIAPAIGFDVVKNHKDIDHPILPTWWEQKIKMTTSHDFTLLVDTNQVKSKK